MTERAIMPRRERIVAPPIEPRGLSRAQAASLLNIAEEQFVMFAAAGRIPPPILIEIVDEPGKDNRWIWDPYNLEIAKANTYQPYVCRADVVNILPERQLVRAVRMLDRAKAAAYCRCDEQAFTAMIKDGIFPDRLKGTRRWDKKALDVALGGAEVKPRTPSELGYVYFAELGDFIKIGFSRSPESRIDALRTGSPLPIRILGAIRGTFESEKEVHAKFRHLHERLEWFRKSPGLLAYIQWLSAAPSVEQRS